MITLLYFILALLASPFKSKSWLEAGEHGVDHPPGVFLFELDRAPVSEGRNRELGTR